MPFKVKLIKNFQKYLANSHISPEEDKRGSHLTTSESIDKQKAKHRKFIKKNYSVYQMALRKEPLAQRHIVNFFNMVTLNQEAIRSEECQESYFRSLFYTKSVRKVQARQHFLIISLTDSDLQFPPLQYSINRFRSFGDQRFHHLACLMEQVAAKMRDLEHYQSKKQRDFSKDQVEEYVSSLGNRIFCAKSQDKYFLSKSFLEVLEYNPEDFALELIRYRTSLHEGCSCFQYFEVMKKVFENLSNLISLLLDKISLETFLDNSIIRFKDYLYSKNHKKLAGKMKSGMPNPFVTIFEVEEITSVEDEYPVTPYFSGARKTVLNGLRDKIRQAQINSLRKIIDFPTNYHPEYKQKVAGYISANNCHQPAIKQQPSQKQLLYM